MGYEKGLYEVADGVWAYLQPDGSWGWSNAGLITSDDQSILVDTLFDLHLTREMLDAMQPITDAGCPIATVVNTHCNGDHWFGNSLVRSAQIVASRRCADEMADQSPPRTDPLSPSIDPEGVLGTFIRRVLGPFSFDGIELVRPTRTFEGELELQVGDRIVRLLEVGPAHTAGDVVAYLPDERVMFTGDILFHRGHPIVWSGPVANWIAACDRILELGPTTVVPGHGPLANLTAISDLRAYFTYLTTESWMRFEAGMTPLEAARDIDLAPYRDWGEGERVVANIHALYRDFGASEPAPLTVMEDRATLALNR
jgi:cyclase